MNPVEHNSMTLKKLPSLLAFAAMATFGAPSIALAQDQPPQGPPPGPPGQQQQQPLPSYASGEEEIHGRISQIGGKYQISVRDDRGFIDSVMLHDGTIINPTGLTLQSGQAVSILGHTDGKNFDANEVDTPYRYGGGWYRGPYYSAWVGGGGYWGGPRFYGRFGGRF
jgi:hypothetical protein